jgi:hypothetical protein
VLCLLSSCETTSAPKVNRSAEINTANRSTEIDNTKDKYAECQAKYDTAREEAKKLELTLVGKLSTEQLVAYVDLKKNRNDPAALAHLRSGLPPGEQQKLMDEIKKVFEAQDVMRRCKEQYENAKVLLGAQTRTATEAQKQ